MYVGSLNLASDDCFLLKKSLAAVAIFWGQYQETQLAVQILSEQVQPLLSPFADYRLPEPSSWLFVT